MIITQEILIRQIADKEHMDVTAVRNIFKSAEDIIFYHLSSTAPSENMTLKLFKGIILERTYIKKKNYSKGMFKDVDCDEHIKVKASSSTYYSKKVNDKLFGK